MLREEIHRITGVAVRQGRNPTGCFRTRDRVAPVGRSNSCRENNIFTVSSAVGEAAAEVETTTGAVVHAFTSGTMVQVFQLAGRISAEAWNTNGNGSSD